MEVSGEDEGDSRFKSCSVVSLLLLRKRARYSADYLLSYRMNDLEENLIVPISFILQGQIDYSVVDSAMAILRQNKLVIS